MDQPDPAVLAGSAGTLLDDHDALFVDLDGVVQLGPRPVDGAAESVAAARAAGLRVRFVTNNASRTPGQVAEHLSSLGVAAAADEVVTAAVTAVEVLRDRLPSGSAVLVVGGEGVRNALRDAGLRPVSTAEDEPVAVLQGWAAEVDWTQLAEAAVAIRAGAAWLATNLDLTLPSPRGPLPGNGSLVAALAAATGRRPESVGKPERALFDAAAASTGARRPLMIGDRLDTDIAGGNRARLATLLVLTGVSTPADLLRAAPASRPAYLGRDLTSLRLRHQPAVGTGSGARCGGVEVCLASERIDVSRTGAPGTGDGLDGLRALCALVWRHEVADDVVGTALATLGLDATSSPG